MNTTRAYDSTRRAASMEATRRSILQSAFDLFGEKLGVEIVLADVAARAGTTVKTILRHFGNREALFDEVAEFARHEIAEERTAPVGDIDAAVAAVHAHYERRGDWVLRMLAQEHSDPRLHQIVEDGRSVHRLWVTTTFAPQLHRVAADRREVVVDLVVVATDIYTWAILRRDLNRPADAVAERVRSLLRAVLEEGRD